MTARDATGQSMIDAYRAAEVLLDTALSPLVLNESIHPHWIGDRHFWYRRERPDGGEYVLVTDGLPREAFDHVAVASSMSVATGHPVDPWALAVDQIDLQGHVVLSAAGRRWRVNDGGDPEDLDEVKPAQPDVLLSPDKRYSLLAHADDLYLRTMSTGDEQRLTDDGEPFWSWGKFPDAGLLAVVRQRDGLRFAPFGWAWSPDGAFLVGGRLDERNIAPYPFLESVPRDGGFRPKVYAVRQPLTGEPNPMFSARAIDVETGRRISIELPADLATAISSIDIVTWSSDNRRLFFTAVLHELFEARLLELDVTTGVVRTLISEQIDGFINLSSELYTRPNVRILEGGRKAIWYSQRDGYGHLYRYDLTTGQLINPLTSGAWVVRDILKVDEAVDRLFFTAAGREGGNPYLRRVYSVALDGTRLTLLTPEQADHTLNGAPAAMIELLLGISVPPPMVSPDSSLLIDTYSTVSQPSRSVVRSTADGSIVSPLETADASALLATGWRPPEPFIAKAADGVTDLYGVIHRPLRSVQGAAPVIEAIYGGPQMVVTPHNFAAGRRSLAGYSKAALTGLGFAVVVVDGRGTPLRSKAFHDAGHFAFADICVDDHAAVLRQLCGSDAALDVERIGIYGHSFGGYTAARAILRYPEIYKVAVSMAGVHNLHAIYRSMATITATPDYGHGLKLKPDHRAVPDNFSVLDNCALAAKLEGKLMLVYGDMDENVFPALTLQFCDALNRANRSYDLLYLPNRTHAFVSEPYVVRRLWDYFVEHLMRREPPANYAIAKAMS
jgi:dipeptidyl-peptidase-4